MQQFSYVALIDVARSGPSSVMLFLSVHGRRTHTSLVIEGNFKMPKSFYTVGPQARNAVLVFCWFSG